MEYRCFIKCHMVQAGEVFFHFPSPLQHSSWCQMDSGEGLAKGLSNIAPSLSKLQASQEFGFKLPAGISPYKPTRGFSMSVRLHLGEYNEKGMVSQHSLIRLFAIPQTAPYGLSLIGQGGIVPSCKGGGSPWGSESLSQLLLTHLFVWSTARMVVFAMQPPPDLPLSSILILPYPITFWLQKVLNVLTKNSA